MLELNFGNYTIKREDKHNVTLTVTKPKGSFAGVKAEGTTVEILGYYGTLHGALKSLLNRYVLDVGDLRDVQSILNAISTVESQLKSMYRGKQ